MRAIRRALLTCVQLLYLIYHNLWYCALAEIIVENHSQEINAEKDRIRILTAEICEDQKFSIKCPQHTSIQIEKAAHGYHHLEYYCRSNSRSVEYEMLPKPCRWTKDVYKKFSNLCSTQEECSLNVTVKKFIGRPDKLECRMQDKTLILDYKCKPSQFMNDNICENTALDVKCRRLGQKIAVYSATYGKKIKLTSLCDEGLEDDDCAINVDGRIMNKCHGQYKCLVNITDVGLGSLEHCTGKGPKLLNLIYMCVDENIFDASPAPHLGGKKATFHKIWPALINDQPDLPLLRHPNVVVVAPSGAPQAPQVGRVDVKATTEARRLNDDSRSTKKFKASKGTGLPIQTRGDDVGDVLLEAICSAPKPTNRKTRSCLNETTVNFILLVDAVDETYNYLLANKQKTGAFFGLSASAGLIFSMVIFALYMVTRQPKHRTDRKPDLIPLPSLPLKIIDPLTLSVDDAQIYQPYNRYATLRKSGTIPIRSNYRSSITR